MAERLEQQCRNCESNVGFTQSDDDGYFYCDNCSERDMDIIATGLDEEQLNIRYSKGCNTSRRANPVEPTGPTIDFEKNNSISYDEYYSEIRSRYLNGLQFMIQLQCRALVDKFNVSPLIIGLVGPLWLRFVASTRITSDEWADQTFQDSESQIQAGEEDNESSQTGDRYGSEPINIHRKRIIYVWYRSLRTAIPISCSLAISFLVCHLAREPITPSDISNWTLEGKIPYFSAFLEIETKFGPRSEACPILASCMFRPIKAVSSQKLESMAADVARRIRLQLPPVNFHAVASRYLRQLSLPIEELLPLACRICEWSNPPELYLSANELRIPTRVCVVSIVIVAIRVLYGINGYGMWESSLSNKNPNSELMQILEAKYNETDDMQQEYSSDLPSYLDYCKDVVFPGLRPSYRDPEKLKLLKIENELLDELWEFYQNNKDIKKQIDKNKTRVEDYSYGDQDSARENRASKDLAIKRMKMDMEDNKFWYIPPRSNVKRKDYIHYARKREDVYVYAVHADYYVLLRSCAKVAQVETRIMHIAVLALERRLQWMEKRADSSLRMKFNLNDTCGFCNSESATDDDRMDLSI
ncbi:hypothetical protein ACP275_09G063200 [Erythranthe tilingii]